MPERDPAKTGDQVPSAGDDFVMKIEPEMLESDDDFVAIVDAAAPPRRPGFGFFVGFLWCLLMLFVTQLVPGVLVLLVIVLSSLSQPATGNGDAKSINDFSNVIQNSQEYRMSLQALTVLLPVFGVLFSWVLLRKIVGKDWTKAVALRLPHWQHVVLTLVLVFPFMIFNISFEYVFSYLTRKLHLPMFGFYDQIIETFKAYPTVILVLGACVGPAISEELFCRGFLGRGLCSRYSIPLGVLLTSLLFGIIHVIPVQLFAAFLMGTALHFIYIASRSIIIPIILHFSNNLISILSVSERSPFFLGNSLAESLNYNPIGMIVVSLFLTGLIGWAFWASRVRIISPDGKPIPPLLLKHVDLPSSSSANRAFMGEMPLVLPPLIVLACCLFGLMWYIV